MRRATSLRPGYTLVELIVALCVFVLAIMFIIPAIITRRGDSRQNFCRNNLKNLALAVNSYETYHGHIPGYREDIDGTPAPSPNDDRSWIFVLLPYLDNRALYDQLHFGQVANSDITTSLELTICPSNPVDLRMAGNDYVANTGPLDALPDVDGQIRPYDFAANGVFHNCAAQSSSLVPLVTVTFNYIASSDGLSTTLLLGENADAARWTGGPLNYGDAIAPAERWMGFTWHHADGQPGSPVLPQPPFPLGISVRTGDSRRTDPPSAARGFARPSSHHVGVCNFAFCDGRVRAINNDISYAVYQALMTPRGRNAAYTDRTAADGSPLLLPAGHAARQTLHEDAVE